MGDLENVIAELLLQIVDAAVKRDIAYNRFWSVRVCDLDVARWAYLVYGVSRGLFPNWPGKYRTS